MDVNSKSDNGTNGNGGGRAPEGDAGYVPPEVHTLNEIGALERLVQSLEDGEQRDLALRKLRLLSMQLGEVRAQRLQPDNTYHVAVLQRLTET